jgi:SAM-dependent methyltransferase
MTFQSSARLHPLTSRGPCPSCGAEQWEPLAPPQSSRSVTSGGVLLEMPLRKLQCQSCGLLAQSIGSLPAKDGLYRHRYAFYHQRPGTLDSEKTRYAAMADWIFAELGEFQPTSVLDVGCGAGLLLEAMRRRRPALSYSGIEPSIENGDLARGRGFAVTTGFVPGASLPTGAPGDGYDLVMMSNVITHIADPIEFLAALRGMTAPSARVAILLHNGVNASADLLFADVELSLCREHLAAIASRVGLQEERSPRVPPPSGQADKQVLIFRSDGPGPGLGPLAGAERDRLLAERRDYFSAWRGLARLLSERARAYPGPVLNFGASFWSMTLAAYCPEYWARVDACVVDNGNGRFLDKPVIATDQIDSAKRPLIVLGTNPASQAAVAERLQSVGDVLVWNDLVQR